MVAKVWNTKSKKYLEQFKRKLGHPSRGHVQGIIKNGVYSTMLECGIGAADIPRFILDRSAAIQYTGIDCTETFLDNARELYPSGQFRFDSGDMNALPYKDDSFDLVYTRHTLEHLQYYTNAVKEIFRVARKQVVIVLFHNFVPKDKIRFEKRKGVYLNYYSKTPFVKLIRSLSKDVRMFRTVGTAKFGSNIIADCTV